MARARAVDVTTTAVGALSGAVAGLVAALVGGGTEANLVLAAAAGLAVGAVGGLVAGVLRPAPAPPPSPAVAPAGAPLTAGDLLAEAGPAPAAPPAGPVGNLTPLVTSIGNRYRELADRQLGALGQLASAVEATDPSAGTGLDADSHARATRLSRRMRRLAKTLEVLADDPNSPEDASPAPIAEVIRAAIADNDEQARIDFSSLHPATVDGPAVADLVHLLAELVDNAIVSSATNGTKVVVLGRRTGDGYLLSVVDEGVGMVPGDREAANSRLSAPPALAQQSPTAFGLPTAGRLAARHDIAVHLLEAATDGLIAKVRIPARLLDGASQAAPRRGAADRGRGADGGDPAEEGGAHGADDELIDLTESGEGEDEGLERVEARPSGREAAEPGPGDRDERRRRALAGFAPNEEVTIAAATAAQRAEAARRVVRRPRPQDEGKATARPSGRDGGGRDGGGRGNGPRAQGGSRPKDDGATGIEG